MFITVETFEENNQLYVFIAAENTSGARYPIKDNTEIGTKVQEYIDS